MRSALALLALLPPLAAQKVLVVDDDPGPGVDHASVAAAVAAAQDGDVLLIRDGTYEGDVTIAGTSLSIVADGADVNVFGTLSVLDLGPGQAVLLAGFHGGPESQEAGLVVSGCAGPVTIDGVSVSAGFLSIAPRMVAVDDSDAVVFRGCSIEGALGFGTSGRGLDVVASSVHLYDTTVVGGATYPLPGGLGDGGIGVRVDGGSLFALGGSIQGGQGDPALDGPFGCPGTSGDGGDGLLLTGAAPTASLYGTVLLAGEAGEVSGACPQGLPGEPHVLVSGTLDQDTSWPVPHLAVDSPVRDGDPVGVSLTGAPHDLVWIAFSATPALQPIGGVVGPLTVGSPLILPIGSLGLAGAIAFHVPTFVPPGAEAQIYVVQALFVDALGRATLSEPAPLVELDAAL